MSHEELLTALPDPVNLRRLAQSLAALDAILCNDPADRRYSFDASWGDGESMASMRDGSGDQWFAVFTTAGVAILGLTHESPTFEPGRPKPWVFGELPAVFHQSLLHEPAFDSSNSTYCIWRLANGDCWCRGVERRPAGFLDDGMQEHLSILTTGTTGYVAWASENYEVELRADDVAAVIRHAPITRDLAARLNPSIRFDVLQEDLASIGYPTHSK